MKYKVLKSFTDMQANKTYAADDVIELTDKRAKEIMDFNASFIEKLEDKRKKAASKKEAE